jgi:hypothetical protein
MRSEKEKRDMRVLKLSLQCALSIMLFLIVACTSTKFSTMWKDETYHGHPEKILVINSFPNAANRRTFEEEFVKALKERGIDAVMSYPTMPDTVVSDKDTIAAQAKKVGADTVLVNKSLGTTKGETIAPGGSSYTGFAITDVYINTQTDVYDMKSNKLILSAAADTWIQQDEPYLKQIQSYVKDLVNQLSRMGLF